MPKADLFPELALDKDSNSTLFHSYHNQGSRASIANLVSDNLHDSTDAQIAKLVSLKFNNNPYALIRQLSCDLSEKATELILLREEKARRENELRKLCMEFGNLSYVEIDKRLNELSAEKDVHKVLSALVNEAVKTTPNEIEVSVQKIPHAKQNASNGSIDCHPSQKSGLEHGLSITDKAQHRNKLPVKHLNDVYQHKDEAAWSNWLHWLNLSEENLVLPQNTHKTTERDSKNISTQSNKSAVELDSIVDTFSPIIVSTLYNTDRFGFVTDKPLVEVPSSIVSRNASSSSVHLQNLKELDEINNFSSSSINETSITSVTGESLPQTKSSTTLALSQILDKLKLLNEQSAVSDKLHIKEWDLLIRSTGRIGKPKSEEDVSVGTFGLKACNLKKHNTSIKNIFNYDDDRSDDRRLYKLLEKLIIDGGIPAKYRNLVWFDLSGAKSRLIPGEYLRILDESLTTSVPLLLDSIDQIELDLHRTLPSNIYFNNQETKQPGPQSLMLKNILSAFVAYRPEIGYCQGMNKLVGNIMLGVNESHNQGGTKLSEECVFWIFVCLVEDVLPTFGEFNFFHPEGLNMIRKKTLLFDHHFEQLLPHLKLKLVSLSVEIEMIVISWWIGVFTEAISAIDPWFRIIDGLLIAEDPQVKFHAYTLAVFKIYQRILIGCKDAEAVYGIINLVKLGSGPSIRSSEFMTLAAGFEKQLRALRHV